MALIVQVVDAVTKESICDASVDATDGAFSESLTPHGLPSCAYSLAQDRPGAYHLVVSKPGYATAERDVSVALGDDCHVNTRTLTIELSPTTP
jgi:hypothetical protein